MKAECSSPGPGIVMLLVAACFGCGAGDTEVAGLVAHVGESPVSLEELEHYFELNLLTDPADEMDATELNRVKSRLLDTLIDEKIILVEAERRGFEVGDAEIDAVAGNEELEPGTLPVERRRTLVRDRIMIRKLMQEVEQQHRPASEADVRTYIERTTGGRAPSRRVRLRSLRFDSLEIAAAVHAQIRVARTNFDEAVANHGTGPDQGVPRMFAWNSLSEELQAALGDLQPGQVSRPIALHGNTFLFQLESWHDDPAVMDDDLLRQARKELERRRNRRVFEDLLRRLREATPVRIHESNLPFEYMTES